MWDISGLVWRFFAGKSLFLNVTVVKFSTPWASSKQQPFWQPDAASRACAMNNELRKPGQVCD